MVSRALRVLIVPDKFKGTMSARQAAKAIAAGWHIARAHDELELLPMADGGDGFGEILGALLGAEPFICDTVDAAGRPCRARWWWSATTGTALLEAAQVNGLALLPTAHYHPYDLDTYGLGDVLRAIAAHRPARLYVGIGGSATNDGGFGMARALGWRFLDARGCALTRWTDLNTLARIEAPDHTLELGEVVIAVDVSNPLLGPQGASRIYGPQKGLRQEDMAHAESCLIRLAAVVANYSGMDIASMPGAGAAGGLGFGLRAFCAGRFESGAAIFSDLAQLPARIAVADWVVTAEGALDEQSLMGKGVGAIAAAADQAGKPCICLAGSVTAGLSGPWSQFTAYAIVPQVAELTRALAEPETCLQQLAHSVAAGLKV